ncbi:MAG TPA: hypothetical protein VHM28_11785 [Anaerolineales bacterium]|jgi:hypothetical protein|nr:hypothetical protein [Anaerolineales bacterium]
MIQGSELTLLNEWHNFYTIMGTAAATLMGLMFVVTTLTTDANRGGRETLNAGISAFTTPSVVHFCAVLLLAALLSAPWGTFSSLQVLLVLVGVAAVLYMIAVMRLMRRIPHYPTPLKDWLWYLVFPFTAYILLVMAAVALGTNPAMALYLISAVMLLLLFLAVHNGWDLVTFFAIERSASRTTRRKG